MQEIWVRFLGWEDPLEEEMATHSSILAWGKFYGQRSLTGYSPWGCKRIRYDLATKQQHTLISWCYYYLQLTGEETEA